MNRLFCFLLLLTFASQLSAQAPGLIKFQAIARATDGTAITEAIEVRLSVLKGAANGPVVYVDEQTATPNARGLFTVNLGEGPMTGTFSDVAWADDAYFLLAEIRQAIGQPYEALGEAQPLLSVPYALYGEDADADPENELQSLSISRTGGLRLSGGNSVDLGLPTTKIVSIPAAALNYSSESTVISNVGAGLQWANSFSSSATIFMPRPADYRGGDVSFKILFLVATANTGKVEFFIRPRSFDSEDTFVDASSIVDNTVSVTPTTGFGRFYEQEITIPASQLTGAWWYISIQRNSGERSLLDEDVNVLGTSLEYGVR